MSLDYDKLRKEFNKFLKSINKDEFNKWLKKEREKEKQEQIEEEKRIEENYKKTVETSPCCNAKTYLSARSMGKEAWRCSKCKKYNVYKLIVKEQN